MYEDYLTRLRLVEYFEIIARTAVRIRSWKPTGETGSRTGCRVRKLELDSASLVLPAHTQSPATFDISILSLGHYCRHRAQILTKRI